MMVELFTSYPLVSDQINRRELSVVLRELNAVLERGVSGDVVELGCYVGTAALFMQRLLRTTVPTKSLHVYDSFAGLPPKTVSDASPAGEQFKPGELAATKAQLIRHFKQAGLPLPVIHKAWFHELGPHDMPEEICFAFLDGDFYESIMTSLELVWPRLTKGAVVVTDDYQAEALPGVRRAVDEWAKSHKFSLRAEASLAILHRRE